MMVVAGQAGVMAGCLAPLGTCLLSLKDEIFCYEFGTFLASCSNGCCHLPMCGFKALQASSTEYEAHSLALSEESAEVLFSTKEYWEKRLALDRISPRYS